MNYICFFFFLYWFSPFLKFGLLSSESPRCAPVMGISNLTGKRVKNMKESAVSDHLLQCDCTIDFDNFDILPSDTNSFRFLIKESLLIKCDKPVLNRKVKSLLLKLFD